jgi:indolepyruvate ferredoxin oxidoreductase beta subunit
MTPETKRPRFKLLVVGVGGQGVLTASKFLGNAAFQGGLEVNVGQLHGMAQRGGSVECSVLIGPGRSSWVSDRSADAVLGLEPLEVLRAIQKISPATKVVLNLGRVVPLSLAIKDETYPPMEAVLSSIRQATENLYLVDGPSLVRKTGVPRTLNVVMLGALAGLGILPFDPDQLWAAIEKKSPEQFLAPNKMAFDLGMGAVAVQTA